LISVGNPAKNVPIANNAVISIAGLGGLNIQATTAGAIGSVKFGFDGNPNFRVEGVAPYAFCGDSSGSYNTCSQLVAGFHTVTATAYSSGGASGTVLNSLTVQFTLQ
jgi:hypothetical protein